MRVDVNDLESDDATLELRRLATLASGRDCSALTVRECSVLVEHMFSATFSHALAGVLSRPGAQQVENARLRVKVRDLDAQILTLHRQVGDALFGNDQLKERLTWVRRAIQLLAGEGWDDESEWVMLKRAEALRATPG